MYSVPIPDLSSLGADRERIAALIRPFLRIEPRKPSKSELAEVGSSRFGGVPDLPVGVAWPASRFGRIDFVGQLDLVDVSRRDVDDLLPKTGLLAFFCGWHPEGWDHAVLHFDVPEHELAPCPADSQQQKPARAQAIDITAGVALPPPWSRFVAPVERRPMWIRETGGYERIEPVVELEEAAAKAYWAIYEEWIEERDHYDQGLFGYDRTYEAEQHADEIMLLSLHSGGGSDHDFIEASCLHFLIPADALAGGDFTRVRAVYGATI